MLTEQRYEQILKLLEKEGSITVTEVKELLKRSYDKAFELLKENREILDKIAGFLYEKETITGKEFMQIFREARGEEQESAQPGEDIFEEE